jgi:hypothetical protein
MIRTTILSILFLMSFQSFSQQSLRINEKGYFEMQGLNVTVFSDFYPDGHQTGVTIIQHGNRVAANGDLRLEASPGQWSPVPKGGPRTIEKESGIITQKMWYPDSSKNRTGFNPIEYPDLTFSYVVEVKALEGRSFSVAIHLDEPLPEEWIGKVGFNFELFPGDLFGKSWLMDQQTGIFHMQPNGPVTDEHGEYLAEILAKGKRLIVAPESELQQLSFDSNTGILELRDGRTNHNNGWYVIRELIPTGATDNAIRWTVTPNVIEGWLYEPVIQVSQLGYHPDQVKKAIIELDPDDQNLSDVNVYRLTNTGKQIVKKYKPAE